jgi:hypothetical protein
MTAGPLDESGSPILDESGSPILDEGTGPVTVSGRIHGRSGVAYLSLNYGDAAAPVAFLSGWDINYQQQDFADTTVLTDTQHVYTAGLPAETGSFTGWYDTATAQTYSSAVDGLPRNMYLYPSTKNPGQFFSGLVLPDYALGSSVTGAAALKVQWSAAGPVTKTG